MGDSRPDRVGAHVVRGSVTDALHELDAGLEVRDEPLRGGWQMDVLGLRLEGWAVPAVAVLGLGTLMLLVGGPEPERATRWAWFWLMLALPPLVCPAYLALGGMLRERPEPGTRRLRGGWAFVLALVLGAAVGGGA